MKYYFLVPSLPPLSLQDRPDISFSELSLRLEVNLSKADLEKARLLRRFVDICNIRALLVNESIDPRGNLNEKELDEALLVRSDLPDYVFDFLDQFDSQKEQIRNFSGLLAKFFQEETTHLTGFLKRYFTFEREWRLVLVALRAKQYGRDFVREFQFEDPKDTFIVQILAQKDASHYEPPEEYTEIKEILLSCKGDPWLENRYFTEYRLRKIDALVGGELFSIDAVLGYMAKLMLIEALFELEEEKGKSIVEGLKAE